MNILRNTTTYIKNREVRVGQIAKKLSKQIQGTPPSNIVNNPRNYESVNVVTTIAQKEKLPNPEIIFVICKD